MDKGKKGPSTFFFGILFARRFKYADQKEEHDAQPGRERGDRPRELPGRPHQDGREIRHRAADDTEMAGQVPRWGHRRLGEPDGQGLQRAREADQAEEQGAGA